MKRIFDSKWFWFGAFALAWLALRVFWLSGDSGIPSLWEYGYHVTDEGYYLSGGKELYLWNSAVDLDRGECLTYGYAAGMNWLSYLAHKVFGLSTWKWRLPFFLIYFLGALAAFGHVARRSGVRFAFLTCVGTALVPLAIVYERSASNDALMGALVLLAYVLAFGKGLWRLPASALVLGFVMLIKPSFWAFLPVVLSAVLAERKSRSAWLDAGAFVVCAVGCAFGWKTLAAATVSEEAARLGLSSWAVLGRLTANYGLPNFFDFANDFKALAAFPRDPSYPILGPLAVLILALPLGFFVRQVFRRAWNARLLLYLFLPAYVIAASVMNTLYTHYYLPVVLFLPILFSALREDLAAEASDDARLGGAVADGVLLALLAALALFAFATSSASPAALQNVYSRVYNLPAENPWTVTAVFGALGTLAVVALLWFRRGLQALRTDGAAAACLVAFALSVVLAGYPALHLASALRTPESRSFAPMCLNVFLTGALLLGLFFRPSLLKRRWTLALLLPVVVLVTYLATPVWRSAAGELLRPATHVHAEVAAELAKLVPEGAVVIGERTDQAFLSLPVRTAATFISNSDPTPVIEALWKRDPSLRLFAFADSQHAYNLQHYQKHRAEFELRLVKTFRMPSFATGRPADVYLCQIVDRRPKSK